MIEREMNGNSTISDYQRRRRKAYERAGGRCEICGKPVGFDEFYLTNLAQRGGPDRLGVTHRHPCYQTPKHEGVADDHWHGLKSTEVRDRLKDMLWERDGGICPLCGEPLDYDDVHFDHILPKAHGGRFEYDNLQLTHPLCNVNKGCSLDNYHERRQRDTQHHHL